MESLVVRRNDIEPLQIKVRDVENGPGNRYEKIDPKFEGTLCRMLLEKSKTTGVRLLPMPLQLQLCYIHTPPN